MEINFQDTWSLIVRLNSMAGLFSFKENSIKTRNQKIYQVYCLATYLLFLFITISGSIMYKYQLIMVFINISMCFVVIIYGLSSFEICRNQVVYDEVFDWCREIYSLNQYHQSMHRKVSNQLNRIQKISLRIIKGFTILCISDMFLVVVLLPIVTLFLPEEIYPKYTTPLPTCLPIQNRDNWPVYGLTVFIQITSCFTLAFHFIYTYCVFTTILIHIMGFLDIILETVEEIKCYILVERDFDQKKENVVLEVLKEIHEETQQENPWSYNDQIKILTDMISTLME